MTNCIWRKCSAKKNVAGQKEKGQLAFPKLAEGEREVDGEGKRGLALQPIEREKL